ncbi:hypothetical protein [Streptomyces sp. NPDC053726]|uniref:hypothetical protein n=1 Tax=Streptomyces sp. NPDC053726 TaxID=3365713 RepID=UPI0037D00AE1
MVTRHLRPGRILPRRIPIRTLTALLACGAALMATTLVAALPAAGPTPPDPNHYPFGRPTGIGDFQVPPPPEAPTLVPTIGTKTTQRLYGSDPFQEAVSVTQHIWPAALPENASGENDNVPDRPWAVTLITTDDPLTGITAVPLIHFPDDAPILYVTKTGIPQVTLNELKRLGDTGISRHHNIDAFLVGAAANPAVQAQLKAIGMTFQSITAPTIPGLADAVDRVYGSIQNPDTGVPQMGNSGSQGGAGMMDVMIASMNSWEYALPATHWSSHMPTAILWVTRDGIPPETVTALKRRMGRATIYLWGGPDQISPAVAKQLNAYGAVQRITNDDPVDFNATPKNTPETTAIAFAKMWDPAGMVGWNITGPGHGFTLVRRDDWQGAVASAPLSHLGFHSPLLLTDSADKLPEAVEAYYKQVAPTYLTTPAEGPYNMTYIIGDWKRLSWPLQAHVDYISEMSNRRVWNQSTGGRYSDSGQP